MREFKEPRIQIEIFDENIVTASSGNGLKAGLGSTAGKENLNLDNTYNISYGDLW